MGPTPIRSVSAIPTPCANLATDFLTFACRAYRYILVLRGEESESLPWEHEAQVQSLSFNQHEVSEWAPLIMAAFDKKLKGGKRKFDQDDKIIWVQAKSRARKVRGTV